MTTARLSPDAWVLLRPRTAFRALAARSGPAARWTAWRRPLFLAFVFGSIVSISTTGSLTLRLVASAMLTWSFVPAVEVGALAIVLRAVGRRQALRRSVDLFGAGFAVWSLWLIGCAVIFAALSPGVLSDVADRWLIFGGPAALLWSVYVDYCFFREVVGLDSARARRGLLLHRALSWPPILLIISQPAIVPTILYLAGR